MRDKRKSKPKAQFTPASGCLDGVLGTVLSGDVGLRGLDMEQEEVVAQLAQHRLTVVLHSFPESNGRTNWTAMFKRVEPFKGLRGSAGGVTIDRGECWNRVAYHAERARVLLGERVSEPDLREYGDDVKTPQEWKGQDPEGVFAKNSR